MIAGGHAGPSRASLTLAMLPESPGRVLDLPEVVPLDYGRNVIREAVCELRFPVLLEFEASPPTAFHKALRSFYPRFDRRIQTVFRPGPAEQQAVYLLGSKDNAWTITLKAASVSLATGHYTSFETFRGRLNTLLQAFRNHVEAEFFTRVGLRYINVFPVGPDGVSGWVRDDLARPLVSGVFGDVAAAWTVVRGRTRFGGFLFQHGVPENGDPHEYFIDTDMYAEDVEPDDVVKVVEQANVGCYELFDWTLGPKAREYLARPSQRRIGASARRA